MLQLCPRIWASRLFENDFGSGGRLPMHVAFLAPIWCIERSLDGGRAVVRRRRWFWSQSYLKHDLISAARGFWRAGLWLPFL
jgi:hypothetical protein